MGSEVDGPKVVSGRARARSAREGLDAPVVVLMANMHCAVSSGSQRAASLSG
jgi:hypothetical protein